MVTNLLPPSITNHFRPWSNCKSWVVCNDKKQPCTRHDGRYEKDPLDYKAGELLKWKSEPQDHISLLSDISNCMINNPSFGFGVILGVENSLVCFDFDHVLDDNGNIISDNVESFIELLSSFTEISSSTHGLHVFLDVELKPEELVGEYGYKKGFCDGRCYVSRFIKMTGNVYENFDLPVKVVTRREFETVRRKISSDFIPTIPSKNKSVSKDYSGNTEWDNILDDSDIIHIKADYKSKTYPDGSIKYVVECFKIPCPNRDAHTNLQSRKNKFGPDAAILTRFDDGTSSVTCNHHSCDPEKHPNLLQKLWDEVRESRVEKSRAITDKYDGVL